MEVDVVLGGSGVGRVEAHAEAWESVAEHRHIDAVGPEQSLTNAQRTTDPPSPTACFAPCSAQLLRVKPPSFASSLITAHSPRQHALLASHGRLNLGEI
eukprot:3749652-Rhodomonas_salina.1